MTVYISQDGSNSAVEHVVAENGASLSKPYSKGFEHWQRPRVAALGEKQVSIYQCFWQISSILSIALQKLESTGFSRTQLHSPNKSEPQHLLPPGKGTS